VVSLRTTAALEPPRPSKPGSVGFEGSSTGESPVIGAALDPAELARAGAVLSRAGVRLMQLNGADAVGVWSDLDGPDVRAALRTSCLEHLPVLYLDGAGISMRYRRRWVEGEPVPRKVLAEMERNPGEPWKVRDRMLDEMGWCLEEYRTGLQTNEASALLVR
jgi:hypothetical protein